MAIRIENIRPEIQFKPNADQEKSDTDPFLDPHIIELMNSDNQVGLYLTEIGKIPLLTQEQEIEIGKSITKGELAGKMLSKTENPHNRPDLERDILEGWNAYNRLIESNTRLVVSRVKKIFKNYFNASDFLDSIEVGNIGLMRAAKKWDRKRKFSTYATWWIDQHIKRAYAENANFVRIPNHQWDLNGRLMREEARFIHQFNRKPTVDELSSFSGIDLKDIRYLQKIIINPTSLDIELPGSEDGSTLGEMSPSDDNVEDIIEDINKEELRKLLDEVLAVIPAKNERIMLQRLGFYTAKALTLQEIGNRNGLTRERIRQIEEEVLNLLRSPNIKNLFSAFLDTEHNGHKPTDRT